MTRARLLTAVLTVILLICAAAVYLDQQGFFNGTTVSKPSTPKTPVRTPATPPSTTNGDGYGELK